MKDSKRTLQKKTTSKKTTSRGRTAVATTKRRAPRVPMAAESDASAPEPKTAAKTRRKPAAKKAAPEPKAAAPKVKKAAAPRARVAKPKPSEPAAPKTPRARVPRATKAAKTAAPAADLYPSPAPEPPRPVVAVGGPAPRRFDEERFLFPRSYDVNRVRLVARDPEWLFAYWDLNPRALEGVRKELGERVLALSRLTLKIADPESSFSEVILLPAGARSWYVRIDASHRRFFAELGITLPSGEFRALARSNVVMVPRSGPSPQGAVRRVGFQEAWMEAGPLPTGVEGEGGALPTSGEWVDAPSSMRPSSERSTGASDVHRR